MKATLTREQKMIIQWRQRLIKLPESIFLDLIRNYLGEVRTPFNKQDLLGRLEGFLVQDSTRRHIITLLTLSDRHLLSAITMLADCSEERLFELVGEGRSYLDFHLQLLNLEDRLLVFREEDTNHLNLNPLLAGCLQPWLSQSLVIPSLDLDQAPRPQALWLDDACLVALYCFLQERGDLFTGQGGLKKRPADDFLARFAGLRECIHGESPGLEDTNGTGEAVLSENTADSLKAALLLALAAFRNLGLIRIGTGGLAIMFDRWLELCNLEAAQRRSLVWGAALVPASILGEGGGQRQDFYNQNRIAGFARDLIAWLGTIAANQSFTRDALVTLWGVHAGQALPVAEIERIMDGLCLLGIIQPAASGWYLNPAVFAPLPGSQISTGDAAAPSRAPLVLTPSFELNISGHLPLDIGLTLGSSTCLRSHFPVTSLVLTRHSVQGGFARGITDQDIVGILESQSGRAVPQNVRISIEEWYRDFQSIQAIDGVTIIARGPRAATLEHLEELSPFILANPAKGILILDRAAISDWRPLLVNAGIPENTLPSVESVAQSYPFSSQTFLPPLLSLDLEGLELSAPQLAAPGPMYPAPGGPGATIAPPPQHGPSRQDLIEELHRTLAGLDLAPEINEELTKRINNSLILAPEQLSAATIRLERSEAGGLDYTAKLRIIEQAVKTRRDFLEVTQHAEHGSAYRLLVWPLKLRQVGNELALTAQTVPAGKELSLMVSKILLVRRIRASIFS